MSPDVEPLYSHLAPFYDAIYGLSLEHGRRRAMRRLAPRPGESILEVGVGTGIGASRYPRECRVTAIDLSDAMLERARARIASRCEHIRLCRMDAMRLGLPDAHFDGVYAPYVLNVVADPLAAAREMVRVCRPDGRIVLLNHFTRAETHDLVSRVAGRLAGILSGVNWHLDLDALLREAGLVAIAIEYVNLPRVSSVVVCRRA
jgi:phosphatidylethanolamine/phosphatidyl-N-methylethanolamine N-methyltransferase